MSRLLKGQPPSGPRVQLGAFGKHPGWNDHIDDQGLTTPALVAFKQTLYVQGITGTIAKWEALDASQRVDDFSHLMLMRLPAAQGAEAQFILARMWSSSDGKGRSVYPMVAAINASGVGLDWLVRTGGTELAALEQACRATTSSAEVVALVESSHQRIVATFGGAGEAELSIDGSTYAGLAGRPELGPDRVGLWRVLYHVHREAGDMLEDAPGKSGAGKPVDGHAERSHHLRLPALGTVEDSLIAWANVLIGMAGEQHGVTVVAGAGRAWVDAVLGKLTPGDVFCLKAGESVMPLTTQIPYTIDPGFVAQAQAWVDKKAAGPARVIGASGGKKAAKLGLVGAAMLVSLAGAAESWAQTAPATSLPVQTAVAQTPSPYPDSPALTLAWRRTQRQAAALESAGNAGEAAAVRARGDAALAKLDSSIAKGIDRTDLPSSAWLEALDEAGRTRRDRILRQIVDAWRAGFPEANDATLEKQIADSSLAHSQWLERAGVMASQLARMDRDLDLGQTLDAPTPAGTLREIIRRWEGDVLTTDPFVRDVVQQALARAKAIETIERSSDAKDLVRVVNSDEALSRRLAAWRRLGQLRSGQTPWPATPDDLRTETAFTEPLTTAINAVPDPARREALLQELAAEQRSRLDKAISTSTDAATVSAAIEQARAQGVTGQPMTPRVRYNIALLELKTAVSDPTISDQQARDAAEKFIREVRDLPGGVGYLGEAQATITPLQGILAGRIVQPASPIPADLGPAGTGLWVSQLDDEAAVFRPTHPGLPTLAFVRVPADGRSRDVAYVSTTEVSVDVFSSVIHELSSRKSLVKVLPEFDLLRDPRRGIRTWDWSGPQGPRVPIVPSVEWFRPDPTMSREVFAPGLTPPSPTGDMPMTHISPAAALFAARLVGCRLPSPGEWERANERYGPTSPRPNLRDATWAEERDFLVSSQKRGHKVPDLMDAVFHAGGDGRVEGVESDAQASATPDSGSFNRDSDGILFFRSTDPELAPGTVAADVTVRDLVGNAAEWVMLPSGGDLPLARPTSVLNYLSEREGEVRVIGGSALSDPSVHPGTAHPVVLADAREGYADVGFRLAFTVPGAISGTGLGLAAQIDRLLTPTPLLSPR